MEDKIINGGEFIEKIFPCGHTLRMPLGYKLTKTFDRAKAAISKYECGVCKKIDKTKVDEIQL